VIISGKLKLRPRKSGEAKESIRKMERQNIAAAEKMDAGTSSHRQQPSLMEAFVDRPCSVQSLAKKERKN
jgi:hypothetical protein